MLYREMIAVCSQMHTKPTNTLCGQNPQLLTAAPRGVRWARNFGSERMKAVLSFVVLL
jgi:hypothetical protein